MEKITTRLKQVFPELLLVIIALYGLIFFLSVASFLVWSFFSDDPMTIKNTLFFAQNLILRMIQRLPLVFGVLFTLVMLPVLWFNNVNSSEEKIGRARMAVKIDLAIEDEHWRIYELESICDHAILNVCAVLGGDLEGELSIAFVDDARIQELNRDFRQKDKPTNVLSFPMSNSVGGLMLGDIVLARETIERETAEQKKDFSHHLTHLIIHGFLHLLGYDHMDDKSAAEMEAIEIAALLQLGIDNPYELKDLT